MQHAVRRFAILVSVIFACVVAAGAARADIVITTNNGQWTSTLNNLGLTDDALVFGSTDILQGNPVVGHLDGSTYQFAIDSRSGGTLTADDGAVALAGGQSMQEVTIRQRPHLTFDAIRLQISPQSGASGTETIIVDVGTQSHPAPVTETVSLSGGQCKVGIIAYNGQHINSVTLQGSVPIQSIGEVLVAEGEPRSTASADFNGDGVSDLLFYDPTTGGLAVWFMAGTSAIDGAFVTQVQDPHWSPVGVGDFAGDGSADILFQNPTTGQLAVWFMSGVTPIAGAYVTPSQDPAWRAVAVADFNGDGRPDILFQNPVTGQLAVWFMNGTTAVSGAWVTPAQSPAWRCVGAVDLNADGRPDLVFQNAATGRLAVWFMEGVNAVDGAYVTPTQDPAWAALAVGDFAGDGNQEIVFQNTTTGLLAEWTMQGATAVSGAYLSPVQVPWWHLAGPR